MHGAKGHPRAGIPTDEHSADSTGRRNTATSPDVPEALPRKHLVAERLSSLSEDEQGGAIAARDAAVARAGHRVLQPGPSMGAGLMLLRLRERGDVVANLRSLLDASEPSLQTVADDVERPTLVSVRQP